MRIRLCSFCHKSEQAVGKLVANPRAYRRAYICDECVDFFKRIVEDDKRAREPEFQPLSEAGRFAQHELASEFLVASERWAVRDLTGLQASDELDRMRSLAVRMFTSQEPPVIQGPSATF